MVKLYPDLEDELSRTERVADRIIINPATGRPFTQKQYAKLHRAICVQAGLPLEMSFTGFRHGGSTEMGDAGIDDIRPVTAHDKIETTRIYNKANQEKAERIGLQRRAHVRKVSERRRNDVSE